MNSKERVKTVLEGGIPDKVPYAEYGIDSDMIERILGHPTYIRNHVALTLAFWENRHEEVAESWRNDQIELHKKIGVLDIVSFSWGSWELPAPNELSPPRKIDERTWEDSLGRVYLLSEETRQIVCVKNPLQERSQPPKPGDFIKEPEAPSPDPRSLAIVDSIIRELGNEKYILGPSGGQIGMLVPGDLPDAEKWMFMAESPEIVKAAVDYELKKRKKADSVMIRAGQDGVLWGCDYGHSAGTFISPAMMKDLYLEAEKERAKEIRAKGMKIFEHCCGNVWSFLDFFVDIGIDVYESIQESAGMDLARLKREYGSKLTLWGGVPVETLLSGSADEVRAAVRRALDIGRSGGRFILCSSHSIHHGVSYDNYMAMIDEYQRNCEY